MCATPKTPLLIDLETRSACDLRVYGGYRYATDPTTRLLTVSWSADLGATYHVWFPGRSEPVPEAWSALHLPGVTIHVGEKIPEALAACTDRPWVAHNAWTFDRTVWAELQPDHQPVFWIDSYPLALSIGLPGGLNKIGELLWDEGKYTAGAQQLKQASKAKGPADCDAVCVPFAQQILVGRYNVQDVKLLADLWKVLPRECRFTDEEQSVLRVHDSCNSRGVLIDVDFAKALIELANDSRADAVKKIADLTAGALPDEKALRSRVKVFEWMAKVGIAVSEAFTVKNKKGQDTLSLGRALVARYIDEHENDPDDTRDGSDPEAGDDDEGLGTGKAPPTCLPLVVKVLELRMQALRITTGKLDAVLNRVSLRDRRLRFWAAYWAAHTGRWAGRGFQPHNLPRGREGVDVWGLVDRYEMAGCLTHRSVTEFLPIGARGADGKLLYPYLSADDAAGAMIRMTVVPDEGKTFAAADLSNIEARVLAWLAGEQWLMDAFWNGSDPYIAMAIRIFGPAAGWPQFPDPKKAGEFLPLKKHPYRQVGKVVVLGCGYGLGISKFGVYAASNGIDLDAVGATAESCILAYRRMHPKIAGEEHNWEGRIYFRGGIWHQYDEAARAAVERGGPVSVGPVEFSMRYGNLIVTLPSGRELCYRSARIETRDFFGRPVPAVHYRSPRWKGLTAMYPGKWAENIVQATSRDVQAHGMVRVEDAGMPVVMHVHDEIGACIDDSEFPDFMRCVTTRPAWLTNFPLDAEGSCAWRYAKTAPPGVKDVLYRNGEPHK